MVRRIINLYRFTKSERKSLIFLSGILILVNGFNLSIKSADHNAHSDSELTKIDSAYPIPQKNKTTATDILGEDGSIELLQNKPVDINAADSIELLKLYGIGPVFASRIVKYRNLLGGYINCFQLLEVYGMDSVRYDGFRSEIIVGNYEIRKMNINSYGFRDFLRHPYLDYESVKKLVRYRDLKGPVQSTQVLWSDSVLDLELRNKLLPYITVN